MPLIVIEGMRFWAHKDRDEFLADVIAGVAAARELDAARAFNHMDLPLTLTGTPANSAITLGSGFGQICGPKSGYAWRVTRLVVGGLTAGAAPDVVNLYKNDNFQRPPLWQFNGNNFGYTFDHLQLVLRPGESFSLQNVGTLAATGTITLAGEVDEVPAEMIWKVEN